MEEIRRGAKGQLRQDYSDLEANGMLGDWCFERDDQFIIIRLPDSDTTERGNSTSFPIKEGPNLPSKHWGWDGNREAPTLTPSLHWIGVWHGWMRAGELISA